MKKIITMFLVIILTLSLSVFAFASTDDSGVIFEREEIKDVDELWERASKSITDDDTLIVKSEILDSNVNLKIKNKSTSQALRKVKKKDGAIETLYATTVFTSISKPVKVASLTKIRVADSGRWDTWDPNGCVNTVATYYYWKQIRGNYVFIKPTKLDCKWFAINSTTLSNGKYGAEWEGETKFTGGSYVWNNDYATVSTISLGQLYTKVIKDIPNDGYINCSVGGGFVAFTQTCKATRGGSSWTWKEHFVWG